MTLTPQSQKNRKVLILCKHCTFVIYLFYPY